MKIKLASNEPLNVERDNQLIDLTNCYPKKPNIFIENEGIYQLKDNSLYPVAHPDLSTQPSILPQRFGNLSIKEVLIARGRENEIPVGAIVISAFSFNNFECCAATIRYTNSRWVIENGFNIIPDFTLIKYVEEDIGYYYYQSIEKDVEISGIYYEFNAAQQARIIKNPNRYSGSIVIPETVNYNNVTYNVTSIGIEAFFGCEGLTSVTIPNSVTSIGSNAFWGCYGLASITIPSITSIGADAFRECSGLTSITIPNSVTNIGNNAFFNCSGLTKVIVSDIAAWCGISFGNDDANPLKYAHNLYSDENTKIVDLVIPNSILGIGSYAFSSCFYLKSITIPNSVTNIGNSAFSNCQNLTSITIGNNVTIIGDNAFNGCSRLATITIPNSVTSIGNQAFQGCSSLTSIAIPNSVTSIGYGAFLNCNGLTSVTIPNSVTSISTSAFNGCFGLTSITIPNGVTSIGTYAFSNCTGLTSVTIPNSVTNIGNSAFSGCSSLTSINVDINTPLTITYNTFSNQANATLYVPAGSKAAYEAANYWKEFKEIIEMQ